MTIREELLRWQNFLTYSVRLFTSWENFLGGILESWSEWKRSRKWWIIASGLPFVILLLCSVSFVTAFSSQNDVRLVQAMIGQLDELVDFPALTQEVFQSHLVRCKIKPDQSVDGSSEFTNATPPSQASTSSLPGSAQSELRPHDDPERRIKAAELLLARAREVSPLNVQIRFRTALIAARENDLAKADAIMWDLADDKSLQLPQANAWVAVKRMSKREPMAMEERRSVEENLRLASEWKDVDPLLLSIYSKTLMNAGRGDKAVQFAKRAAELQPSFYLGLAQLLKQIGPTQEKEFQRAAKQAEDYFRARLGTSEEKEDDRSNAAVALWLTDRVDVAMELLRAGMGTDEQPKKNIRRFLADLLVAEYQKANVGWLAVESMNGLTKNKSPESTENDATEAGSEAEEGKSDAVKRGEIDFSRLIEAAKIDPDNPLIGVEVALHVRNRKRTPQELNDLLTRQIRSGIASTKCQLLVSERYLEMGRTKEARNLWEKILEKDPLCLPALNNLSVVLSREAPSDEQRSLELINKAYAMYPLNAEVCDSYGEIYRNLGRPKDAISKFEEAIRIDPARIESRKMLSSCYRETGLGDLADEQDAVIVKIQELRAEEASESKS